MKIPLIVIAGPTASGKTDLAISIAEKIGGEIVSADSMQIYKKLSIGTAKPTSEELAKVSHHMIDILDINEKYSVVDYVREAKRVIEDIYNRGKIPIIAGGTGLYIDSLVYDSDFSSSSEDTSLRESLSLLAEKEGKEAVYKILENLDENAAKTIHKNNLKRVIRAIEIIKSTDKSLSESIGKREDKETKYDLLYLYLDHDREVLYERINKRVDKMVASGIIDEAAWLYDNAKEGATALQAIGYKEFFPYFNGEETIEEAIENLKKDSRHYAKRQITWFKRNKDTVLIDSRENPKKEANKKVDEFMKRRKDIEK